MAALGPAAEWACAFRIILASFTIHPYTTNNKGEKPWNVRLKCHKMPLHSIPQAWLWASDLAHLFHSVIKVKAAVHSQPQWVTAQGGFPSFISRDHITIKRSPLTSRMSAEQSCDLPVRWQLITSTIERLSGIAPSHLLSSVFQVRTWTIYSYICAARQYGGQRLDCWVIKREPQVSVMAWELVYASITKINWIQTKAQCGTSRRQHHVSPVK